jgi:hypothetical protein
MQIPNAHSRSVAISQPQRKVEMPAEACLVFVSASHHDVTQATVLSRPAVRASRLAARSPEQPTIHSDSFTLPLGSRLKAYGTMAIESEASSALSNYPCWVLGSTFHQRPAKNVRSLPLVSALTPEPSEISVRVRGGSAVSTRTRWCEVAQENNHLRACVDLPKGPYELSCQDRTEHRMLLLSCLQSDSPHLLRWCTSCRVGLLITPPQLFITEVTSPK